MSGLGLQRPTNDVHPRCTFDDDFGFGHVIKPCLEQELVSVITAKVRQVRELDFLCSVFSDEGEGSLLDSQALQILFNGLVVSSEAFNC